MTSYQEYVFIMFFNAFSTKVKLKSGRNAFYCSVVDELANLNSDDTIAFCSWGLKENSWFFLLDWRLMCNTVEKLLFGQWQLLNRKNIN